MNILSSDQQTAYDRIVQFICDPTKMYFVLEGFAGSGKSTLMRYLVDELPKLQKTFEAVGSDLRLPEISFTATTHKAAENLSVITGMPVVTIHSLLGLRLQKDYKTGRNILVVRPGASMPSNQIIIVDESSYLDKTLLNFIQQRTRKCKIIFMGDPYQLVPVGLNTAPVFDLGLETVRLTGNHRNQNLIQDFSASLRNTIETGEWFQFKPDGNQIIHASQKDFNDLIISEFTRPDWKYNDSRVLAYTNDRSVEYNNFIQSQVKGTYEFEAGDYARSNKYVQSPNGNAQIRNDETVFIQEVSLSAYSSYGVGGKNVLINHNWYFHPNSIKEVKQAEKNALENGDTVFLRNMSHWLDLRAHFSETVNKSQGSTYKKVFIDLNDVSRASTGSLIARLLYVGASRAQQQVILTGDLV